MRILIEFLNIQTTNIMIKIKKTILILKKSIKSTLIIGIKIMDPNIMKMTLSAKINLKVRDKVKKEFKGIISKNRKKNIIKIQDQQNK